jgi:uncharacterized protein
MESQNRFAIVTGASQGFGKALAYEIAKRKFNLILVSLPNEGLSDIAEDLKRSGIEVLYYEVDLTIKEKLLEFTRWVNDHYNVNMLVNNAGLGSAVNMLESDLNSIDTLIRLNVTAPSLIIHQLLPNLLKQKERTYILNVSSMAAYSPIPFKTVYPASKRFIHDFSRGLHHELKETNVFVSVVHPGPMRTNNTMVNRLKSLGFWGNLGILTPEKAAHITVRQLFRNDSSILLGIGNNFLWLCMTILPSRIKIPLITRSFKENTLSK